MDRAVRILGLGRGGAIAVPVDTRYRMRADALEGALAAAGRAGRRAFAVVASAGTTATGSFDPLEPIADFCSARGLWLHVDAAHGGAAALVPSLRPLLRGIERADSAVFDAHKLLFAPALVSAVLFRDGSRSYEAFAQDASYLFTRAPREEWFNVGNRTLECTKRMLGLEVYAALAVHGPAALAAGVERTFALARRFAARLREAPDFDLAVEPEANIVCFRHRPEGRTPGEAALDAHQTRVRRRILERGTFYLVQTRLPTGVFLRTAIMNLLTTDADLAALLDEIRAVATEPGSQPPGGRTPPIP